MNNLYHKVAVASICTALGIVLGASEEVKAATITLTAPRFVVQGDSKMGGLAVLNSSYSGPSIVKSDPSTLETRTFYEFYISSLSLAPNTVIKSAFFNFQLNNITNGYKSHFIDIVGYVGNGIPELWDFKAEKLLTFMDIDPFVYYPGYTINFDVTQFVNERLSNGDAFAGFGLRGSIFTYSNGTVNLGSTAKLNIETADVAEPVPEPTTIFGSAIALGVGGWLKRKKSSQENKTTQQN